MDEIPRVVEPLNAFFSATFLKFQEYQSGRQNRTRHFCSRACWGWIRFVMMRS